MDREAILAKLNNDPAYIKEVDEDDELKLYIIRNNGTNIKYINNPNKNMQEEAIKKTPLAIKYIKNLDEEVAIMCVKSSWNTLEYIDNPSDRVISEAIKAKGWAIQFVKNPSDNLKLLAVSKDYDAIKYINDPCEEVQIRAIENYYAAIRFIKSPTLKAKITAVKFNGEAINYMSSYDLDEIKMFINENINVVKYIYESIDVDLVVEVLMTKFKDENIDKKYIEDFLELDILEIDKINFIRQYGSKKAKKALVDYKLSM